MDANFWHKRWESNNIAFHEAYANALLVSHFDDLNLPQGSRVFLPLCGKTRDIAWLLSKGHQVVGAELSRLAVEQLFDELGLTYDVTDINDMQHFHAEGVSIFVGDIFGLTPSILGLVDAVYDRAALVALPDTMRNRYATHITHITGRVKQLLICFEYDQSQTHGPPFSVSRDEVAQLYGRDYRIRLLNAVPVQGGLRGTCPADETVWLLD